jgi:uncharacterized beta-barrel protein YwiB (DUF1934 family)
MIDVHFQKSAQAINNIPIGFAKSAVVPTLLQHRCVISYLIPSERVRTLVPEEFLLGENTILSIEAFQDGGLHRFEQINYRLQVNYRGAFHNWLLGTSIGSFSAITARNYFQNPWHLSAIDLQISSDPMSGRYDTYRLNSQSEWSNTFFEIADTGMVILNHQRVQMKDHFIRRDGAIGSQQTSYLPTNTTRGILKTGRCDMLKKLGILGEAEIAYPLNVSLQRRVSFELKAEALHLPQLSPALRM